jgi:hypothetical protein
MGVMAVLLLLAAPCGMGDGGRRAMVDGDGEIWVEPVSRDEWGVAMVNRGERTISLDVVWRELGLPEKVRVWASEGRQERGVVHGGFAQKLGPGGCALIRAKR